MKTTPDGWGLYRRTGSSEMIPWRSGCDMLGVSVSDADLANGSPRDGDMIARNPKNHADKWLVAAKYFRDNLEPVPDDDVPPFGVPGYVGRIDVTGMTAAEVLEMLDRATKAGVMPRGCDTPNKTLHNSDVSGARQNVPDIRVVGNGDAFRLVCKASSEREGWMKSTKAMDVGSGLLVQVTTQHRNPDGSYAVAEAMAYVPGAKFVPNRDGAGGSIVPGGGA